MSWVNLDDAYVNKTGDTIAGDLSVNGALSVNDGKGTDTAYNVANAITTLKNSASKLMVDSIRGAYFTKNEGNGHYEIWLDNMCLYFTMDGIGVYNSATQGGFYIPKP